MKIRHVSLVFSSLLIVVILATGCFRPAAPDVQSPLSGEVEEEPTPAPSDVEASAIANTTRAAERAATQTAEAAAPTEEQPADTGTEEPLATSTAEPAETGAEPSPTATTAPTTPTPTDSTITPVPTPQPTEAPSGETTYVVQPGDNLFRIALRFNTTVAAITEANGITDATQISVGQELVIPGTEEPSEPAPGGTTYVVQPGDNLFRIALRYNLSYQRLAAYNGITDPSSIYVGQVLRIPPE